MFSIGLPLLIGVYAVYVSWECFHVGLFWYGLGNGVGAAITFALVAHTWRAQQKQRASKERALERERLRRVDDATPLRGQAWPNGL